MQWTSDLDYWWDRKNLRPAQCLRLSMRLCMTWQFQQRYSWQLARVDILSPRPYLDL
ncbi:unnamed protein product [Allacma fusca]|uniref:Uncharacterized protein n=1 Tax=Allacma fusca TaxID=39272 RepID=A0A8J2PI61_9HEXA|nr:unnamed protein product [Allacma fusca]